MPATLAPGVCGCDIMQHVRVRRDWYVGLSGDHVDHSHPDVGQADAKPDLLPGQGGGAGAQQGSARPDGATGHVGPVDLAALRQAVSEHADALKNAPDKDPNLCTGDGSAPCGDDKGPVQGAVGGAAGGAAGGATNQGGSAVAGAGGAGGNTDTLGAGSRRCDCPETCKHCVTHGADQRSGARQELLAVSGLCAHVVVSQQSALRRALLQDAAEATVEADPAGRLSHEAERAAQALAEDVGKASGEQDAGEEFEDYLADHGLGMGGGDVGTETGVSEDETEKRAGEQRLRDKPAADEEVHGVESDYYDRYLGAFGAREPLACKLCQA
jgi:hypothetical protein